MAFGDKQGGSKPDGGRGGGSPVLPTPRKLPHDYMAAAGSAAASQARPGLYRGAMYTHLTVQAGHSAGRSPSRRQPRRGMLRASGPQRQLVFPSASQADTSALGGDDASVPEEAGPQRIGEQLAAVEALSGALVDDVPAAGMSEALTAVCEACRSIATDLVWDLYGAFYPGMPALLRESEEAQDDVLCVVEDMLDHITETDDPQVFVCNYLSEHGLGVVGFDPASAAIGVCLISSLKVCASVDEMQTAFREFASDSKNAEGLVTFLLSENGSFSGVLAIIANILTIRALQLMPGGDPSALIPFSLMCFDAFMQVSGTDALRASRESRDIMHEHAEAFLRGAIPVAVFVFNLIKLMGGKLASADADDACALLQVSCPEREDEPMALLISDSDKDAVLRLLVAMAEDDNQDVVRFASTVVQTNQLVALPKDLPFERHPRDIPIECGYGSGIFVLETMVAALNISQRRVLGAEAYQRLLPLRRAWATARYREALSDSGHPKSSLRARFWAVRVVLTDFFWLFAERFLRPVSEGSAGAAAAASAAGSAAEEVYDEALGHHLLAVVGFETDAKGYLLPEVIDTLRLHSDIQRLMLEVLHDVVPEAKLQMTKSDWSTALRGMVPAESKLVSPWFPCFRPKQVDVLFGEEKGRLDGVVKLVGKSGSSIFSWWDDNTAMRVIYPRHIDSAVLPVLGEPREVSEHAALTGLAIVALEGRETFDELIDSQCGPMMRVLREQDWFPAYPSEADVRAAATAVIRYQREYRSDDQLSAVNVGRLGGALYPGRPAVREIDGVAEVRRRQLRVVEQVAREYALKSMSCSEVLCACCHGRRYSVCDVLGKFALSMQANLVRASVLYITVLGAREAVYWLTSGGFFLEAGLTGLDYLVILPFSVGFGLAFGRWASGYQAARLASLLEQFSDDRRGALFRFKHTAWVNKYCLWMCCQPPRLRAIEQFRLYNRVSLLVAVPAMLLATGGVVLDIWQPDFVHSASIEVLLRGVVSVGIPMFLISGGHLIGVALATQSGGLKVCCSGRALCGSANGRRRLLESSELELVRWGVPTGMRSSPAKLALGFAVTVDPDPAAVTYAGSIQGGRVTP